jgi:hypothetical protein
MILLFIGGAIGFVAAGTTWMIYTVIVTEESEPTQEGPH